MGLTKIQRQRLKAAIKKLEDKGTGAIIRECHGYVAGGYFLDSILDKAPKDIDIYFDSVENANKAATKVSRLGGYVPDGGTTNIRLGRYELMRFITFPNAQECIQSFDFSCVKIAWDGYMLHFGENTLADIKTSTLRLEAVNCPLIPQMQRIIKYTQKGFVPDQSVFTVLGEFVKDPSKVVLAYEKYKGEKASHPLLPAQQEIWPEFQIAQAGFGAQEERPAGGGFPVGAGGRVRFANGPWFVWNGQQ